MEVFRSSRWVLCAVGRAHFEKVDYHEAERVFELARRKDPTRLEGMEVFSTVLWHLKKEVELSFLAQEVTHPDTLRGPRVCYTTCWGWVGDAPEMH
jgi:anaphase-promoting complex subunit 3